MVEPISDLSIAPTPDHNFLRLSNFFAAAGSGPFSPRLQAMALLILEQGSLREATETGSEHWESHGGAQLVLWSTHSGVVTKPLQSLIVFHGPYSVFREVRLTEVNL